jgi:hypothetical protein
MTRQRLWVLFGGLGWLAFFMATLSVPASADPAIWPQITSMILGLGILMAVLLSGEKAYWPAWLRWVVFLAGLSFVVVPYLLNISAPEVANQPQVRAFVALGLMMIALPVGYWIGDRMEKVTNLIPLAIAMSLADIYSVFQGPSKKVADEVVQHQQEVAEVMQRVGAAEGAAAAANAAAAMPAPLGDFIIVHLPLAGTGASMPVLGIGDFVIFAFLFRAAWVHNISVISVFVAGFLSTIAALMVSNMTGTALPALPFIALGTIGWLLLTQPRLRRLDKQEAALSVGVLAVFGALLVVKWL